MKTTLSCTLDAEGIITVERKDWVSPPLYTVIAHHERKVLDTMDQMIINRLVELGWTPPDGKKPTQDG